MATHRDLTACLVCKRKVSTDDNDGFVFIIKDVRLASGHVTDRAFAVHHDCAARLALSLMGYEGVQVQQNGPSPAGASCSGNGIGHSVRGSQGGLDES